VRNRILVAVMASGMAVAAIAPAYAATYGPGKGYTPGPKGGDNRTQASADPNTGEVMIFQRNDRQAAAVHCVGEGPYAKLRVHHPVTEAAVSSVKVTFTGATMSEHPVIDVLVWGSKTGWLGHGASHGPKANESGTIDVALGEKPVPGETMEITFGLQVHAGCNPHPTMLGLTGSRPVEGGQATFPSVEVS
jgi:hypothetical protein